MKEDLIVRLLKDEQAGLALESLRKPNLANSFEYGYRCGITMGLEIAMNKIVKLHQEEENE